MARFRSHRVLVGSRLTANQTEKYQVVQKTGANAFTPYGSVTTLNSFQSGQNILVNSTNPVNPKDTTTPYGVLVTISSNNPSAPANEPFKIRAAAADISLNSTSISNTETTSGYYPLDTIPYQAVNYINLNGFVRDTVGYESPNEKVQVTVRLDGNSAVNQQIVQYTSDLLGSIARRFTFAPCTGTVGVKTQCGPIGSKDRRDGTHQDGYVLVQSLDNPNLPTKRYDFRRICSETYRPLP